MIITKSVMMMSKLLNILSKPTAFVLAAGLLTAPALPQAVMAQTTTQKIAASDAFPGLQKFLSLPSGERSQVNVYYVLRIKKCDSSQVRLTLTSGGTTTPLTIAGDGRVTPLPNAAQLSNGTVNISGPSTCVVGPKVKVFSTQGLKTEYDAAGLATGIKQGNAAMTKIAGVMAVALPKLDRVHFIGGGEAVAEFANGQKKPLPRTGNNGEYPAGTPYFVPSQMGGAVKIHLSSTPRAVMFDNPPK
ncbi:hypothetical protein [Asticcacaulis sp. 201]|uniref:hypothetical protein n=1 Tax=Asticcacaulis sp. 201 TaxID=3028787 RepID=UPI002915F882|nr:hypothetical protein [Asticcacaulis sp. 201]MDV6329692.1 hypothetical protein [Asticcacaulis sp. 201]